MSEDNSNKEELLKQATEARSQLLEALTAMQKSTGCQLILRRSQPSSSIWQSIPMDDPFSLQYRLAVQETLEVESELDLCLLEYDAMSTGENIGVAYKAEISDFLAQVPAKGKVKKFSGDAGTFAKLTQRCVRINAPGGNEVLAFGPSGVSPVAALKPSSVFALFKDKKIVKPKESGFLNVGRKISFFVFKEYVFVVDNRNFASMTNFRKVVQKRAVEAANKLNGKKFLKIENFQALLALCKSSPDFARRLSASDARGFIKNLTREGLISTMSQFTVSFEHSDDGKVVTLKPDFSKVQEKRDFQKLMTQVFVNCAVTGDPMEAFKLIPHKK